MGNDGDSGPIRAETRGRPRVRVQVRCGICPNMFEARPSEVARGGARYCSDLCRNEARSQGIPALEAGRSTRRQAPIEMRCEVCQTTFRVFPHRGPGTSRQARYCSEKCATAPPVIKAQLRDT